MSSSDRDFTVASNLPICSCLLSTFPSTEFYQRKERLACIRNPFLTFTDRLKDRQTDLLLLRRFQHFFGPQHKLVFIFVLLLKDGHSRLQLVDKTLLLVTLCVKCAVLPPQGQNLLLRPLTLLNKSPTLQHHPVLFFHFTSMFFP